MKLEIWFESEEDSKEDEIMHFLSHIGWEAEQKYPGIKWEVVEE